MWVVAGQWKPAHPRGAAAELDDLFGTRVGLLQTAPSPSVGTDPTLWFWTPVVVPGSHSFGERRRQRFT